MTLPHSLCKYIEYRVAATEIECTILAQGRQSTRSKFLEASGTAGQSTAISLEDHGQVENKIGHNTAMRFRNTKAKYLGGIGESWMEFFGEYQQVARDYSRIATHNLDFQQLYGELEAALHLQNEAKVALMRDSATSGRRRASTHDTTVPGTMFQGQGRYLIVPNVAVRISPI